uniref:Uncharacterized protein n=1 Tax=Physcomitrium patens TaxID=3218 RepID=A0A2K1JFZ1_PHYPA|nr:hypothetical protein PHYPA_017855 [Physcomitrium patens]
MSSSINIVFRWKMSKCNHLQRAMPQPTWGSGELFVVVQGHRRISSGLALGSWRGSLFLCRCGRDRNSQPFHSLFVSLQWEGSGQRLRKSNGR